MEMISAMIEGGLGGIVVGGFFIVLFLVCGVVAIFLGGFFEAWDDALSKRQSRKYRETHARYAAAERARNREYAK